MPRRLRARPQRRGAEAEEADAERRGAFAHLGEMRVGLAAGLVDGFERRAGQFELAAGLERDRAHPGRVGQADDVAAVLDPVPAEEALHQLEERAGCRARPRRARGCNRLRRSRTSRARCRRAIRSSAWRRKRAPRRAGRAFRSASRRRRRGPFLVFQERERGRNLAPGRAARNRSETAEIRRSRFSPAGRPTALRRGRPSGRRACRAGTRLRRSSTVKQASAPLRKSFQVEQ